MFKRQDYTLISNPYCTNAVENLDAVDFQYYDKDGFELNIAEQKFYSAMNYPIQHALLNHTCWQQPWFTLDQQSSLILDHSAFLCRCAYAGDAAKQLQQLSKSVPQSFWLSNTKAKWGFDFALDAVQDNQMFEVLHIEYDSRNFDTFNQNIIKFEYAVKHTDWEDAADQVWQHRDQWQHLTGFEQNHWKAEFLLGWRRAEYTEKAV
jgi:hypothetical protein